MAIGTAFHQTNTTEINIEKTARHSLHIAIDKRVARQPKNHF